jgi:DNA repair exonuclease SbcCD ATPase subunit
MMYSGVKQYKIEQNAACAGNFVQNQIDDGYNFGALLWKQNSVIFAKLQTTFDCIQMNLDGSRYELPNIKIKNVILRFTKYDKEFVIAAIDEIKNKYGCDIQVIKDIQIKNKLIDFNSLDEQAAAIQNLTDNAELVNRYRSLVNPKKMDVPQWKILYLEWDNLFAYKERNHINFEALSPMTFIVGRNKSGKSSIIDIITLAIFNSPIRCKLSDIINENCDGEAYLKCVFQIEDTRYTIERTFKRDVHMKQQFKFYSETRDLSESTVAATYSVIRSLLPIDFEKFKFNIMIQGETSFVGATTKNKKNLVYMLLGMEYLKEVVSANQSEIRSIQKKNNEIKKIIKKKDGMMDVEAEVRRLEGEVRAQAAALVNNPGNIHAINIFRDIINKYIAEVENRQQLILKGVKPIGAASNSDSLEKHKLLGDAMDRMLELFFNKFCEQASYYINLLLLEISDFYVTIEVEKNSFAFYIVNNKKKVNVASASGYQKFLVDLVARVVFLYLSKMTNFGIIFIDEGFGCLDEENFIKVAKALKLLKKYTNLLVITHVDELKTYADKVLQVDNKVTFGKKYDVERVALHDEIKPKKSQT